MPGKKKHSDFSSKKHTHETREQAKPQPLFTRKAKAAAALLTGAAARTAFLFSGGGANKSVSSHALPEGMPTLPEYMLSPPNRALSDPYMPDPEGLPWRQPSFADGNFFPIEPSGETGTVLVGKTNGPETVEKKVPVTKPFEVVGRAGVGITVTDATVVSIKIFNKENPENWVTFNYINPAFDENLDKGIFGRHPVGAYMVSSLAPNSIWRIGDYAGFLHEPGTHITTTKPGGLMLVLQLIIQGQEPQLYGPFVAAAPYSVPMVNTPLPNNENPWDYPQVGFNEKTGAAYFNIGPNPVEGEPSGEWESSGPPYGGGAQNPNGEYESQPPLGAQVPYKQAFPQEFLNELIGTTPGQSAAAVQIATDGEVRLCYSQEAVNNDPSLLKTGVVYYAAPTVPSQQSTKEPTKHPTTEPTKHPTTEPTKHPTKVPTRHPLPRGETYTPTNKPTTKKKTPTKKVKKKKVRHG